jgi:hypothetical protein
MVGLRVFFRKVDKNGSSTFVRILPSLTVTTNPSGYSLNASFLKSATTLGTFGAYVRIAIEVKNERTRVKQKVKPNNISRKNSKAPLKHQRNTLAL